MTLTSSPCPYGGPGTIIYIEGTKGVYSKCSLASAADAAERIYENYGTYFFSHKNSHGCPKPSSENESSNYCKHYSGRFELEQ